ncbi:MAG: hypothetical protein DRO18_07110 [Thermoprotei archaeon]|nr:MAG: hypothetical protein DRO18_07110 [Thermoprotei archaeon]
MVIKYRIRTIVEGDVEGKGLVINQAVSFLGDLDPKNGVLLGKYLVKDLILFIPYGKGSTVGSYVIYGLKKYGNSPKAIVMSSADAVTITGCILADIPLFDGLPIEFFKKERMIERVRIKDNICEVFE